jgi:hypothetical protein
MPSGSTKCLGGLLVYYIKAYCTSVYVLVHYLSVNIPLMQGYFYVRPAIQNTECPTRYRTRHFFNNSNTSEDIATKFEQEYVHCVRNGKECVCSAPNRCDTEQRSASLPSSVASGTHCIILFNKFYCFIGD